jgi:hypothetical protein
MKTQILAILALGLLAGPIAAQAQYDFEQIDYPWTPDTRVFGISNRADVAGFGSTDLDSFPFVYDSKKGTFTDVAPIAGFDDARVLGISDTGVLVGSVYDDDLGEDSGLIIHKDGSTTVFDHPDSVSFTQARGVNHQGLVTGLTDDLNGITVASSTIPKPTPSPTSFRVLSQSQQASIPGAMSSAAPLSLMRTIRVPLLPATG